MARRPRDDRIDARPGRRFGGGRAWLLAGLTAAAIAALPAVRELIATGGSESAQPDGAASGQTPRRAGSPAVMSRTRVVRRHGVFTLGVRWASTGYENPWEQVRLELRLTSPSGRRHQVGGFYLRRDRWSTRFSPSERGRWSWRATIGDGRKSATFRGAFTVIRGGRGPVRRSRHNRFRWTFSDGSPYYPLGIGDCVLDLDPKSGSPLDNWGLDGGFRPPGVHTNGRLVGMRAYLRAYARAGVNLFRWSVDNCSFRLFGALDPAGNAYLEREGRFGDRLVQALRANGMRVFMTILGKELPFGGGGSPAEMRALERYLKYVVDRYGAYVDFWELANEARPPGEWIARLARYLRRVDPYRHPISMSYERPDLRAIDINSPHWYETEEELRSDAAMAELMRRWKQAGKPVIVGEQGNFGANWDPRSAVRMRLRAWTAFFTEGALVFWNASFAKDNDKGAAAIYLGPTERRYLRVLQRFTRGFDGRAVPARVKTSRPDLVRGVALRGPRGYAAYLHAYTNHRTPTAGIRVSISPRARGEAVWVSPASGRVLARRRARPGTQTLTAPAFITDVALAVR